MLTGTAFLIGTLFVLALLVISTIEAAFTTVNKVSIRRLVDHRGAKAAPLLAAMVEKRAEVMTAIHLVIQFLLVLGSVFVFSAFRAREIGYGMPLVGTVVVMMVVLVIFRHLLPRVITMRSPEMVLLRLFPVFRIVHLAIRPVSLPLTSALNYFQQWE